MPTTCFSINWKATLEANYEPHCLLVALFMNKRRNTWHTAMTHMFLLDPDQVRMMLYYDWLIPESYSANPTMHPLLYNISDWKWLHYLLFLNMFFSSAHSKLGGSTNFGRYTYAIGITTMSCDVPLGTCVTIFWPFSQQLYVSLPKIHLIFICLSVTRMFTVRNAGLCTSGKMPLWSPQQCKSLPQNPDPPIGDFCYRPDLQLRYITKVSIGGQIGLGL